VAATELQLGTRGSALALWQARAVAERIQAAGGPPCRVVIVKTTGDRLQTAPLSDVGGKRLFVKELEDALLEGTIDLAVHSSKDMPAVLPDGLSIAAALPREDPLDAIVLPASRARSFAGIEDLVTDLGPRPIVGTSSVRRIAQLTPLFAGAVFAPIRGNLDTRLRKLDSGEYGALVLAAAGLRRLGFADRISLSIPAALSVPAPGQGIVAVETRAEDLGVQRFVRPIDDGMANAALSAERALVEALGGGCQTPIGALAAPTDAGALSLMAIVAATDGSRAIRATGQAPIADAAALGASVASQLLEKGAGSILADARRAFGSVAGIQP
jgi:hydroxymethylbilane synthase